MDYAQRLYSLFILQLVEAAMVKDPQLNFGTAVLHFHREAMKVESIIRKTH